MDAADLVELGEKGLLRLARDLAVQHEASPIDPQAAQHAGPQALAASAKALGAETDVLSARDAAALGEVTALQERFVAEHPDWIEDRIAAGRVRLVAPARPGVDATIGRDVSAPVADLSVVLAASGRTDLAERLLADYARESNDYPLYRVVDFYEREAAVQRALDPSTPRAAAHRLLSLSRATSRRPLLPPAVVVLGGWVASGKSTVAAAVARRLAAPRIEGDRVREFLEGAPPGAHATPAQRLASLTPGFEDTAYEAFFAYADAVLDSGRAVVLDGGFPTRNRRHAARELATRHGVPVRFIECRVDSETLAARLAARDASAACEGPAWEAVAEAYAQRWEPPDEIPNEEHLVVDTTRLLEETIADVAASLPLWPEERT